MLILYMYPYIGEDTRSTLVLTVLASFTSNAPPFPIQEKVGRFFIWSVIEWSVIEVRVLV